MIESKQFRYQGQHILYDAARLTKFNPLLFEPDYLQQQELITGRASGRGDVLFFSYEGCELALRHYRRGGSVASLLGDRYLRTFVKASRAWREWLLLAHLSDMGLPVPQPVAARVEQHGIWTRCDIVTLKIPGARSLATSIHEKPLRHEIWREIGGTIRRFHEAGVWHADLNAHNILLTDTQVYLIDFDRGRMGRTSQARMHQNVQRLLRSLQKLQREQASNCFTSADWEVLLSAYSN